MEYLIGGMVGMVIMAIPAIYIAAKGADIFYELQEWIRDLEKRSIDGERIYFRNDAGRIRPHYLPPIMQEIKHMNLAGTRRINQRKAARHG